MTPNAMKTSALIAMLLPISATAEIELSFYGGAQNAPHSDVFFSGDSVIPDQKIFIGWQGKSFEAPPYYGIRATVWNSPSFGFGVDFTHNKIYPQEGELPAEFERLEFTDGLNTLTLNAYKRWNRAFGDFTPYVGGGVGVSVPHVEVISDTSRTLGYQFTGPAATWIAGASYPINDEWSVFGEYKGTYSMNKGDLETGGTVETDVITNAVNVGVSFSF